CIFVESRSKGVLLCLFLLLQKPSINRSTILYYCFERIEYKYFGNCESLHHIFFTFLNTFVHDKSDKPVKRETWMLELPEDKPNFFGLGPRQFRKKTPMEKGDRSVWTDTPSDKEKKAQRDTNEGEEKEFNPESIAVKQRDDDLTARVDKYNKDKRSVPLIDLHIKKLKKKGEKSGPKERRPFSREEDLNVNKFDDAQKKSILKKAQQLNDRFSGGGKKFL
ncbi:GPALPP motifs-containing protein 1, partial [Halocaridina rubra]